MVPNGDIRTVANEDRMLNDGPVFVAAIAVRDHWDTLPTDDRDWCFRVLTTAIERDCDTNNEMLVVCAVGSTVPGRHPSSCPSSSQKTFQP